jgi:sugar/nucleoside kinase (ribokinase family)
MAFDLIVFGHLTKDTIVNADKETRNAMGGAATYTSLAAAKLGIVVGIVTKVGMDFEEEYLNYLKKANIDLLGLKVEKEKTTAFENVYEESGVRTQRLLSYIKPLKVADVPASYFDAECFHFGPVFHEVPYDIIKLSHQKGILTSLDVQGYCRDQGSQHEVKLTSWKEAREILQHVDILKCDEKEAEQLAEIDNLKKAAKLILDLGPKIVLVTQGVKGSILCHKCGLEQIHVYPTVRLVDPTGAGDAYVAGFIVEYLRTGDLKHSALFASCVASFVVEGFGAENLPTRNMAIRRLHALQQNQ